MNFTRISILAASSVAAALAGYGLLAPRQQAPAVQASTAAISSTLGTTKAPAATAPTSLQAVAAAPAAAPAYGADKVGERQESHEGSEWREGGSDD